MGPRPSGLTPFKSSRRNLLHSHVAPIVVAMVMAMLDLCRRNSRPTWMSTALSASGLPSPSPSPLPQSPILETQSQLQSRFYGKVGSGSTDDLLRNATAPTAPRCASVNCKSGLNRWNHGPKPEPFSCPSILYTKKNHGAMVLIWNFLGRNSL